jgi:hypothetical protein
MRIAMIPPALITDSTIAPIFTIPLDGLKSHLSAATLASRRTMLPQVRAHNRNAPKVIPIAKELPSSSLITQQIPIITGVRHTDAVNAIRVSGRVLGRVPFTFLANLIHPKKTNRIPTQNVLRSVSAAIRNAPRYSNPITIFP